MTPEGEEDGGRSGWTSVVREVETLWNQKRTRTQSSSKEPTGTIGTQTLVSVQEVSGPRRRRRAESRGTSPRNGGCRWEVTDDRLSRVGSTDSGDGRRAFVVYGSSVRGGPRKEPVTTPVNDREGVQRPRGVHASPSLPTAEVRTGKEASLPPPRAGLSPSPRFPRSPRSPPPASRSTPVPPPKGRPLASPGAPLALTPQSPVSEPRPRAEAPGPGRESVDAAGVPQVPDAEAVGVHAPLPLIPVGRVGRREGRPEGGRRGVWGEGATWVS